MTFIASNDHQDNWSQFSHLLHSGQIEKFINDTPKEELAYLPYNFDFWLRPSQRIPNDDPHRIVFFGGGRGWGKTRAGSAFAWQQLFEVGCSHLAIVGRTHSEIMGIIVKEDSGIFNTFPPEYANPKWNEEDRAYEWEEHGKKMTLVYGDQPEQARGYNFDCVWIDELAKFKDPDLLWKLLVAATRKKRRDGKHAKILVTTTPRPIPVIHRLYRLAKNPDIEPHMPVLYVTGRSHENIDNLAPGTIESLEHEYAPGTRDHKQEVLGELLFDHEDAIFQREMFSAWQPVLHRIQDGRIKNEDGKMVPNMVPALNSAGMQIIDWDATLAMFSRIVVGVDPSGARDKHSIGDMIGIVTGGLLRQEHWWQDRPCVVQIWDGTFKDSPKKWGRRVINFYNKFKANHVYGEGNFGGGMVEEIIKSAADEGQVIPYTDLRASRGKDARAEEIAQWYANGQVRHLYFVNENQQPIFGPMEDQLCQITPKEYHGPERSPDRGDAGMWVVRALLRAPEIEKTYASNFARSRS